MTIYQIDAFTSKLFGGNPAAVIPLDKWIDDVLMQKIALENNLSETVFFVRSPQADVDFEIRWFTPELEINLCGHATLASAYVLYHFLNYSKEEIHFSSKSGILKVKREGDLICMDFPSWKPEKLNGYPFEIPAMLGNVEIVGVYKHRDVLVELVNEDSVKNCVPDFKLMKKHIDKMIITAAGTPRSDASRSDASSDRVASDRGDVTHIDFVSRFFAPGAGIDEDPVTGSAHSQLIPFWSERLGKTEMHALQLSKRGGEIWCEQRGDRVVMKGRAAFYMKGEISLDDL